MRRSLAFLCGLLAPGMLVPVACSSSNPTSSPPGATTTAAPAAAPTTVAPGGSTPAGMARVPTVTKPANVEKVDRTQLPAKAQAANFGNVFTQDEQDCIYYVIYQTVTNDPSIAANDAQLAGVTGAAIVACVSQDKITELLTADLSGKLTVDQLVCLKREINGADAESLSIFLGGLVINEPTIVGSVSKALDAACGTNLAAAT